MASIMDHTGLIQIRVKNYTRVFVDKDKIPNYEEIQNLIPEALDRFIFFGIEDNNPFWIEVDFGRVIGDQAVVETTDDDEIVYARRKGVDRLSRFVMNRETPSTTKMTLILRKMDHDGKRFQLIAAHVGPHTPMEPNDKRIHSLEDLEYCERFWNRHAFVWGTKEVE